MKILYSLLLAFCSVASLEAHAQLSTDADGMEIMHAVQQSIYEEKAVYEELSVILTDERGNRATRSLRKYTRVNNEDDIKLLLLFDSPEELRGVALLASRKNGSIRDISIYLPAFGEMFRYIPLGDRGQTLFGTDFTLQELSGFFNENYRFVRREDRHINNIDYYIVDVFDETSGKESTSPVMKHYIHEDSLYIIRTDYLDKYGRVTKQLTMHDLKKAGFSTWNAAMLLMEDRQKLHSTLVKINKRIISENYVPDEVFTFNWLYKNQPPLDIEPAEDNQIENELIDAGTRAPNDSLDTMPTDQK